MKKGFTLIELLVAAIILTIMTLSFGYLFHSGINSLQNSKELLAALNSAQAQMEEIRSLPFDQIKSSQTIAVKPITYDLLEIKLTANWKEGKRPIELYTMRSKY